MSTPPPQEPNSGQPPQPPGQPSYPQQPAGPGQWPQGPPPGTPQYAPPPGAPTYGGPPQPPHGPGQPPYGGPPQPPYGPGQPPYGPGPPQPYGQQPPYGPPPQKQGMSTGAKIGIGVGSAVLVLALVIGAVLVLPLGDEGGESAAPETSATDEDAAEENESEDEDDDIVPAPDTEVFTGSDEDFIALDEPHDDARILSVEAEDFASVSLLGPNDEFYASAGSKDGETHRVLYNHFDFEEYDNVVAIQVNGMGDWTVTLEPLSTAVPWTDPDEPLEDVGSEVYAVDWDVSGEDVAAEHSGESNFAIWAMDLNEGNFELLINEIGDYEGTNTLPPGTTLLEVAADGEWSLSVS